MCTKVDRKSNFMDISMGILALFAVKNAFHPLGNASNNFVRNRV